MSPYLDIFVGTDRSQLVAVAVLEHSIKRHTAHRVRLCPLIDLDLPEPRDIRNGSRTGFSFARFAIPELMGFEGRALYLDADMLVFRDIEALWRLPFGNAKVLIQGDMDARAALDRSGRPRTRQCSVMLMDCGRLKWDARSIIEGLDGRYDYDELLSQLCILEEADISESIPFRWNSLEHFDDQTCLLHYTDMLTQPWVSSGNPLGRHWLNELHMMLEAGQMSWKMIDGEIEAGYFRPSLIPELRGLPTAAPWSAEAARYYDQIDQQAGFVKHAEAFRRKRERLKAVREFDQRLEIENRESLRSEATP